VAEVVKAAGFLHGAFNAHFDSKEKLQAAAVARPGLVPRSRLLVSKLHTDEMGVLGTNPTGELITSG
jgi:AcrR family transcriptional regulator